MSVENYKSFMRKVQEDKKLQERLQHLHAENQVKLQEDVVKIGTELGFDFDENDMNELVKETMSELGENGELTDVHLESVVGGNSMSWVMHTIFTGGIVCGVSLTDRVIRGYCELDE